MENDKISACIKKVFKENILIENKEKKRLVIFFFYDKDGVVDDYIPYMLNDLKNDISELLIVCNGELDEKGRKKFEKLTQNILVRENKGFDVWAYKAGLEWYGWEMLAEFDEIILMNFTIMGPLYPFKEMFDVMDEKDIDFWGLTIHHGAEFDPFGKIELGYLPLHLQSHFIAIRKGMIKSNDFQTYWQKRPMITSYEEAICWHEAIFTKTFEDLGYLWDVYVDTRDLLGHSYYPLFTSAVELIKNRRCPVFKRKNFFANYYDLFDSTNGEPSMELFKYIKDNFSYDVNMIFDNILRTQNMADIKKCLHFNYILSDNIRHNSSLVTSDKKIALVLFIYNEDLIGYCFKYACSMPITSHIYIITDCNEKKKNIETVFSVGKWSKIDIIVIENRGRDISALLIGTKDYIMNYDYVCFAHDKKLEELNFKIKGEEFLYKCYENILKNDVFVENIIDTFEKNPRIGLLVPPPPNFGEFYRIAGETDWGGSYNDVKELSMRLGVEADFDIEKEPIAPFGNMFWFRPNSLKTLFAVNWKYEDFPKNSDIADDASMNAIERIYPFVAQHEGYYSAWLITDTFSRIEITNLYYMLRELKKAAFSIYGANTHYGLVSTMKERFHDEYNKAGDPKLSVLFKKLIKGILKKMLPMPIYNKLKNIYLRINIKN